MNPEPLGGESRAPARGVSCIGIAGPKLPTSAGTSLVMSSALALCLRVLRTMGVAGVTQEWARVLGAAARPWIDSSGERFVTRWLGDSAHETLALMARARGLDAQSGGIGFAVRTTGDDDAQWMQRLRDFSTVTPEELLAAAARSKNVLREKWDGLLSSELAALNFASRHLVIARAHHWLRRELGSLPVRC